MKWALYEHPDVSWSIITALCLLAGYCWRKWLRPMWINHRQTQSVYQQLGQVLAQFQPNGGSSLIDKINAIQSSVTGLAAEVTCLHSGLGLLYDQHTDGIFWADARGNVTRASRAFTRWTGWQESELLGRNWIKMIPQSDRESVVRQWFESVSQGIDFSLTYHFQNADGVAFDVHVEAAPVRNAGGDVVAYRGTVRRLD